MLGVRRVMCQPNETDLAVSTSKKERTMENRLSRRKGKSGRKNGSKNGSKKATKSNPCGEARDIDTVDLDTVMNQSNWPVLTAANDGDNKNTVISFRKSSVSLGMGGFPVDGPVTFTSTPSASLAGSIRSSSERSLGSCIDEDKDCSSALLSTVAKARDIARDKMASLAPRGISFKRQISSFMRTSDLGITHSAHENGTAHPNFHHPSTDPPPGVSHDPNENWVAIDNGDGALAPIAPYAMDALVNIGIATTMKQEMWTPLRSTEKAIKHCKEGDLAANVWLSDLEVPLAPIGSSKHEMEVLVWTGKFDHGLYGSHLPAIRAEGIVNMAPEALLSLVVDSSRVKEYNKMSLGRQDLNMLQNDLDEDGPFGRSITKIMRSTSKPPMVRKNVELVSILHAKELPCGNGYVVVSRAITQASEKTDAAITEILMGVNIIRRVKDDPNRCVMININHICSSLIPTMIATRLGSKAAVDFLGDIRNCC
mmetsp:Transcript_23720/g.42794  ORF Transcript_23720/g.42794 Transcript_23720/m.42794 type:complete len:482 (-) Transcript_23720:149-1594(-)